MSETIFSQLSIDREHIRWEEHLGALTPWQNRDGIWFKREDYFAPLGYGGPNGSKMRQLIWYVNRFRPGKTHILTGASVQSPQLSMSAIVGAHYGLLARQVVYSKPHTVLTHENPRIAAGFGARFEFTNGPYNPIIQRRVVDFTQSTSLVVEYGITVPHTRYPADDVLKFHEVGANQVRELPESVRTLIVPAGSCNSLTSILLGLSRDSRNVSKLLTLGIGPDKRRWVHERLKVMNVDADRLPFLWEHHSLHDTKFSSYSDKFKGENWAGVNFHPTYEAKMWRYLRTLRPVAQDDRTGFWIVGSAPDTKIVEPFYTVRGEQ